MSKISKIDNLIARCNSCQDIRIAKCIQRDAISVLKELKCSNEVIQSCRDVSFGKEEVDEFDVMQYGFNASVALQSKALDKGLNVIDTTCSNVAIIHSRIKEHLANGYTCIYIGNNHHPECEGILGIDDSILLVSNINDVNSLNINNEKIYITNQTTLSLFDIEEIYNSLINKYPEAIIDNKICLATTLRQKAIINQENVDLCIIVGDKSSSNTSKLVSTGNKIGINTILVDNIDDIKKIDLTNVNSISISSGASTPSYLVDEIIEYLK